MIDTRSSLAGVPVREAMLTDFRVVDQDEPLQVAVDHLMAGSQQDFPVLKDGVPVGVLTRGDLVTALQRGGPGQRIGDVVTPTDRFVDASEPLEVAVARMRNGLQSALPVLDHGHLVGVLTLENIADLLTVRGALQRYRGK